MKRLFIAIAIALATISCSQMEKMETSVPYEIIDGKIIFETPERLEGQKSVLGLSEKNMDKSIFYSYSFVYGAFYVCLLFG